MDGTLSAVNCTPNTVTNTPKDGGTAVTMTFDTSTTHIVDESNGTVITSCDILANNYLNAPAEAEGQQALVSVAISSLWRFPEGRIASTAGPGCCVLERGSQNGVLFPVLEESPNGLLSE